MERFTKFLDITKLCRTCFGEEINLKKINNMKITIENHSKTVLDLLNLITTIEFSDVTTDNICEGCIEKLTEVYKFKLQCDNSNKLFKNYLNSKKNAEPLNNHIAEVKETHLYGDEDSIFACIERSPDCIENIDVLEDKPVINSKLDDKHCVKKNTKDERFCCTVCGYCYKTRKLLLLHKQSHGEFLQCVLCKEKFSSEHALEKHKNSKKHLKNQRSKESTSYKTEEISNLSCKSCKKTFKSKYILVVHEKRHALKGHFLCTICGKGFNARGCLNRHMRVHTGERKYECSVCKKRFPSSNNLNLHFRIHSGEKPYLCTVCGKSFSHPTGLTYHVRTHTKERRYKCDFCSRTFAVQCHLDNHRKIHTGERPHACKQCDRAFIKKIDLQRHELTHTGVKPHVCTVCDKDFLRPLHLNYHMMIHTAERPHRCTYCGKGFIRRYYLKDHMMKHHGIKDTKKEEGDDTEVPI